MDVGLLLIGKSDGGRVNRMGWCAGCGGGSYVPMFKMASKILLGKTVYH